MEQQKKLQKYSNHTPWDDFENGDTGTSNIEKGEKGNAISGVS
jgi:hypothetical protein